ncbi:hypothetical protein [Rhodococcus jostii]|uniref:hypothetical protein n=1 Tax=Rhodococcus jostii TaxID=132919 RepID=UPI000A889FA2|nr:hypothetical protein [Rhodococcus jostii]
MPLGSAGRLTRRPFAVAVYIAAISMVQLLSVFVVHRASSDMFIDDGTNHPVTSQ